MNFLVSILTAAGTMLCAQAQDAVAQEAERMEGVWRFDSIEVDGAIRPAPSFESNKVIILKDGRFVIMQGKAFTHGVLKADPTKNPKQYDSTIERGPAKGMTFPCIYELDADTFKLCGPYQPGERPTEFVTKSGSGLVMQVLKREKQSVPDALTEAARKELEGTWQGTLNAPDLMTEAEEAKLTFDADGKVTEELGGMVAWRGSTKIDALVDPMAIDLAVTIESNITIEPAFSDGRPDWYTSKTVKTFLGLAQVDGNTLTVVRAMPGKERPMELSLKPGSDWWLGTYQREAAEKK